MTRPVFVVVGAVNRGKSSIVSTLAENEAVVIEKSPGTTQEAQTFAFRLDGQTLYTLVDTPGFELARQTLAWLQKHEHLHADRASVVCQFIQEHVGRGAFPQECELLQPILDGGAILYIVDSSVPYSPLHQAEMEILQWTMQPRMALLNQINEDDYAAEWRQGLDQYFNIKLEFNALNVDLRQRIKLLQTLIILNDRWQQPLGQAIQAILSEYRYRIEDSAKSIADALATMLMLTMDFEIPEDEDLEPHKQALKQQYDDRIRHLEADCFRQIRERYEHRHLNVDHAEFPAVQEDLLETSHWRFLDVKQWWALAGGATAGAITGGLIDASVGGSSFLAGTVIGTGVGGIAGLVGSYKLPEVSVDISLPFWGALKLHPFRRATPHHRIKKLTIGPMQNRLFPYVVLSRAIRYHHLILTRPHARREQLSLSLVTSDSEETEWMTQAHKVAFDTQIRNLSKTPDEARTELAACIRDIIEAYEGFYSYLALV
ncbi:DUF3482 domain-containing protein [Candidatus Entotheonella serta]|nr:DUF3482 domain-containing protein [Candidatus Entotheonella serta]